MTCDSSVVTTMYGQDVAVAHVSSETGSASSKESADESNTVEPFHGTSNGTVPPKSLLV